MRYLTKSRFKLALECLTKLYYTKKKNEYDDQSLNDPFLQALANGGYQVGELAKYMFSEDPVGEEITIDTLDYDLSIQLTEEKLKNNNVVIAEAAFRHENLFVRCDVVEKKDQYLHIYEVKAKSTDGEPDFYNKRDGKLSAKWLPYLYDIAFQKYVVSKTHKNVFANLILVDKSSKASIDGLNKKFKIIRDQNNRSVVKTEEGLKASLLGDPVLRVVNVDVIIDEIWSSVPVPTDYTDNISFEDFIALASKVYEEDKQVFTSLGKKCKGCQFFSNKENELKSGFLECWRKQTGLSENELSRPLVLELWGGLAGNRSFSQENIEKRIFLLKDVVIENLSPNKYVGMSPAERRILQINKVKNNDLTPFFNKDGFIAEFNSWSFPLHMIDFETSTSPLPYFKGTSPYSGVAFQFSHHIIEEDFSIRHEGQFLSFEPGVFPNFDFVRELKRQLEVDNGTVFRYHNHENTYLNFIRQQLESFKNAPDDKAELIQFIKSLTTSKEGTKEVVHRGNRKMVDLYKTVISYYYSPYAKGSNSIKQILPAIINDSKYLKEKYSKPIYGSKKTIISLNFAENIWIRPEFNFDPYKTLPPIFDDYPPEKLDELVEQFDEVADGGSAMFAYNYLQYSDIPKDQRQLIAEALLRYCELDTMAMVMIIEGLYDMCKY